MISLEDPPRVLVWVWRTGSGLYLILSEAHTFVRFILHSLPLYRAMALKLHPNDPRN